MAQKLFEQNIITYAFIGMCGVGFLLRLILDAVYSKLVKETDNFGATNNKRLKHTKMKFETCYKLKIGVNNVDTFVDKNVCKFRFCGILLSTWEKFSGQTLLVSLLAIPLSVVFGVFFGCRQNNILFTAAVGMSTCSFLFIVDKNINLNFKKKVMKLNMLDYLENFCKIRLEREVFQPEMLEEYRREYFQVASENKVNGISQKQEPKDELNRRREARRKKEEEKRLLALKREEEQRKIEQLRKEEEARKIEERKALAAKRREEERLKLEEEMQEAERRRLETKKKVADKRELRDYLQLSEEKEEVLHRLEEELTAKPQDDDMDMLLKGIEEIAAEREIRDQEKQEKRSNSKILGQKITREEEKLIEDVLKEFFA